MELTTIITAALVCMSTNVAASNNQTNLQHRYERDSNGRITVRTAYAWNGEEWMPAMRWTYEYGETGYTVELSCYDSRHRCFGEAKAKTVYAFTPDLTAAYITTYERSSSDEAFHMTDSMLAAYPNNIALEFIASHRR